MDPRYVHRWIHVYINFTHYIYTDIYLLYMYSEIRINLDEERYRTSLLERDEKRILLYYMSNIYIQNI